MRAYYDISVFFKFRTTDPDGLIMFNAGKGEVRLANQVPFGIRIYF